MNMFQKLLDFLNRLDEAGLIYTLEHNRDDAILVNISRDNERWEVEFVGDGDVDVEVFYSEEGDLEGEEALERLFEDSDDEEDLEDDEEIDELEEELDED
jgi:hypothetical protein